MRQKTLVALLLVMASSQPLGWGQTVKPTATNKPSTTKPAPTSDALPANAPAIDTAKLDEALSALKSGDDAGAIAKAKEFQKQLPRKGMNTDPNWVNSNHIIAVAELKLGDVQKSKPPMDFVNNSGKRNRSIILNSAVVDIVDKKTGVHAVNTLRAFVATHPEDEQALDLLGSAIKTSTEEFPKVDMAAAVSDYNKANARLEKAKPGMKHWGAKWMTEKDFAEMETKRVPIQRRVDSLKAHLTDAITSLERTKAEFQDKNRAVIGQSNYEAQQRSESARNLSQSIADRQAAVDKARTAYERALDELPKPEWAAPVPVDIELVE
jgi:hypothetical protein